MNSLFVAFAVLAVAYGSFVPAVTPYGSRIFEDQIKKVFEGWMEKAKEVDPVSEEYLEFDLKGFAGSLTNGLVAGFSDQRITHLVISFNAINPSVELTYEFPYFEASIEHYTLNGIIPGDGTVSLVTKDFKFTGVANYNVLAPWKSVFKYDVHLGGEFKLTGFMNNEELSAQLTEVVNKYLNWFNNLYYW